VGLSEASTTGLEEKTFAKCESIGPVHKSRLKRKIGRVHNNDLAKVEQGVKRVLGL
jgi:mRNA-degrading endonuclease toxin of MazEF toxin-antitoxin module